jgi:lipoyl(octanoyl) transferase
MRYLEEAVITTIGEYRLKGDRLDGMTGVWLDPDKSNARKICAMGVKSSRWVTMHGIGFNVNSDLAYFNNIIPCGIQDKAVTSMEQELQRKLDIDEVAAKLKLNMAAQFGFSYTEDEKNN